MPPKIERELCQKHGPQIDVKERDLKHLYRQVAVDVLEFLFPGISAKTFPPKRLFELGLPRERPDPMDYF